MVIFGALMNGLEAFVGGLLGLLLKSRVSDDLGDFLLKGQGLCVILVAVQGMTGEGDISVVTLALALGAAFAACAVITKTEVTSLVMGGLFVVEALSVIIQVVVFKKTGKRVFLISFRFFASSFFLCGILFRTFLFFIKFTYLLLF